MASAFGPAWDMLADIMGVARDELERLEDAAIQGARALGEAWGLWAHFMGLKFPPHASPHTCGASSHPVLSQCSIFSQYHY